MFKDFTDVVVIPIKWKGMKGDKMYEVLLSDLPLIVFNTFPTGIYTVFQILTLNPSTDLLVTAQYAPVSEISYQPPAVSEEEETRKLMGSDNKEW